MPSENNDKSPDTGKQGWKIDELAEQGSQINEDEIQRRVLRGDETKGDPNDRDAAGTVDSNATPQGREEAKPDHKGAANDNG